MNVCPGGRHCSQNAWLVAFRAGHEHRAHRHLAQVRVLALADGVHAPALPNEAAHRGILMPDVAQLYFGDLTQCVMCRTVLHKAEQGKFANELAAYCAAQDVERKFTRRRRRTDYADAFHLAEQLVEFVMCFHFYPPASVRKPCMP